MAPASSDRVAVLDLAAERAFLGDEVLAAFARVVESGRYVLGPEVEQFERDFARLCGCDHGVGVASGTDALILALHALGVRPGDHVVTTPFTFFASAATIAWIGAVPRLADIDPETALLDPEAAAAAIDEKTVCLLPVHLYGQMADVQAFRRLADERGLTLLEDGAQAHGAKRAGACCGELGDACTISFYPTKNLGAPGEGGLVVTPRDEVAHALRRLRDHGMARKYEHVSLGTNSRLHALQAAALNVKLPHLATWNARRNELARRYDEGLAGLDVLRPLARAAGAEHVFHQYAIRVTGGLARDTLARELDARGIGTAVHYPLPVHLHEAARPWGYGPGDFPHAERLAREVLCLPIHPFLTDEAQERVLGALREAAG